MIKRNNEDNNKSIIERELSLWEAANQYITGQIDIADLEKAEQTYAPDLKKATLALARYRLDQRIITYLSRIKRLLAERKELTNQ